MAYSCFLSCGVGLGKECKENNTYTHPLSLSPVWVLYKAQPWSSVSELYRQSLFTTMNRLIFATLLLYAASQTGE